MSGLGTAKAGDVKVVFNSRAANRSAKYFPLPAANYLISVSI